jgi:type II secretory pathway pseudopilin PulG
MDKNKKIAGVSLVELMIAMVLIAMALTAIVAIFPRMSGHRRNISEADQARIIGMEVLEGVQGIVTGEPGTSCISINAIPKVENLIDGINKRGPIGAVSYTATVECDANTTTGLNVAKVTVKWKKSNKDHNITVTGTVK